LVSVRIVKVFDDSEGDVVHGVRPFVAGECLEAGVLAGRLGAAGPTGPFSLSAPHAQTAFMVPVPLIRM
jgi:hypothetical protein